MGRLGKLKSAKSVLRHVGAANHHAIDRICMMGPTPPARLARARTVRVSVRLGAGQGPRKLVAVASTPVSAGRSTVVPANK